MEEAGFSLLGFNWDEFKNAIDEVFISKVKEFKN